MIKHEYIANISYPTDAKDGAITVEATMLSAGYIRTSEFVNWDEYSVLHYYSADVLKKNESKFSGVAVIKDHQKSVNSLVGRVNSAEYNEGVKGVRGIISVSEIHHELVDSIRKKYLQCVSVSIAFQREKSHPNMSDEAFYLNQGHEVDGRIVSFVVTEIIEIMELSFVILGADRNARITDVYSAHNKEDIMPNNTPPTVQGYDMNALAAVIGKKVVTQEQALAAVRELVSAVSALDTQNKDLVMEINRLTEVENQYNAMTQSLRQELEGFEKAIYSAQNPGRDFPKYLETEILRADFCHLRARLEDAKARFAALAPGCPSCGSKVHELRSSVITAPTETAPQKPFLWRRI